MQYEFIIIPLVALLASLLTFFSGFGLGTILTPVFAIFFPIEIAIALTATVHFLNNIFKIILVHKNIQFKIGIPFALFSVIGAFWGAWVLLKISNNATTLFEYQLLGKTFSISSLKLIVGFVILLFTFLDFVDLKKANKIKPSASLNYIGGIISGFFGGLSGNQGALRSAFLIKYNLEKIQYVATGTFIACCIDFTRLSVYFKSSNLIHVKQNATLIFITVAFAFIGVFLGNKLLKKVSLSFVRMLVTILLVTISILLILGVI